MWYGTQRNATQRKREWKGKDTFNERMIERDQLNDRPTKQLKHKKTLHSVIRDFKWSKQIPSKQFRVFFIISGFRNPNRSIYFFITLIDRCDYVDSTFILHFSLTCVCYNVYSWRLNKMSDFRFMAVRQPIWPIELSCYQISNSFVQIFHLIPSKK